MTQDERFLKSMKITPEAIPELPRPSETEANPLIPAGEIRVAFCEECECASMSMADFQTLLSANRSLAEGARQLREQLAVVRAKSRQWRNSFLLLVAGISATLLFQFVQWVWS